MEKDNINKVLVDSFNLPMKALILLLPILGIIGYIVVDKNQFPLKKKEALSFGIVGFLINLPILFFL